MSTGYCRHGRPIEPDDPAGLGYHCGSCRVPCRHGEPGGGRDCAACAAEDALMDEIFAYDPSDDRAPARPMTPERAADLARDRAAADEQVARQRAWAEQEAWENP